MSTPNEHREEFDYIVIGSGPGGGPLSVRLAEAGSDKVFGGELAIAA